MSALFERARRAMLLAGSLCALGLAALATCDKSHPATVERRAADKLYTVRGQVTMLPESGKPTSQLVIRHEAIDNFENPNGTTGMPSMEMPLPPASGVDLSGLKVGDAIEFDLAVWYRSQSGDAKTRTIESYRVTRVKKLPPETVLKFGSATPTLGTPGSGGR